MATKKQEILELSSNQNFRLIAISSSLNLNKLIWSINAACSIKLVKNADLESTLKLPVFTDRTSKSQILISLIPNKLSDIKLIKQLPNIDFIIEINGLITDQNFKSYIQSIKKVEGVLAAIEINPSTIKRKEPFCPE